MHAAKAAEEGAKTGTKSAAKEGNEDGAQAEEEEEESDDDVSRQRIDTPFPKLSREGRGGQLMYLCQPMRWLGG